jgi:hypothetical protein
MPEQLDSGTYKPSDEITVVYWKAPDKDGDGEEVWEDRYDNDGNSLGRYAVKDNNDNQVYHYEPPKGYTNRPGFDHTDNYVLTDGRGRVQRDLNGEAITIKPGTARVLYPDGRSEILGDEFSRHVFAKAHKKIGTDADLTDENDAKDPGDFNAKEPSKQGDQADDPSVKAAKATPKTVAQQGGSK